MATPTTDPVVRTLRWLAPALAVGFGVLLVIGLAAGTFASEGGEILDLLWGRITLVDVYLAFAVPMGWAFLRERPGPAVGLAVAIVVLGSLAIWALVASAAWRAADRRELLLGRMA